MNRTTVVSEIATCSIEGKGKIHFAVAIVVDGYRTTRIDLDALLRPAIDIDRIVAMFLKRSVLGRVQDDDGHGRQDVHNSGGSDDFDGGSGGGAQHPDQTATHGARDGNADNIRSRGAGAACQRGGVQTDRGRRREIHLDNIVGRRSKSIVPGISAGSGRVGGGAGVRCRSEQFVPVLVWLNMLRIPACAAASAEACAICRWAYSWELSIARPRAPTRNIPIASTTRRIACPFSLFFRIANPKMR